ncbi:MAG TPA: MlaD family protein [Dongiaceae bacterium]|nr:MlaD family protein [Dongiaceae bacterium]
MYYREVSVGRVTGYRLSDTADQILVFVNIDPRYSTLVRKGTRFWSASGVNIDVGLFKGAKIKTESLESVLAGGISFATPDDGAGLPQARPGDQFSLAAEAKDEWLEWKPRIPLPR